jgi:hypothetical protein
MLPQIVGPAAFPASPLAPSAAERAAQGAQPAVGETSAGATRPETANRVDPPRVIPASLPLPEERRRADPLLPPDPQAPAGPPPAFDATPLERAREAALAPADLVARPQAAPPGETGSPEDGRAPDPAAEARDGPDGAPEPVPNTRPEAALRERVEAEVAEVRRMAGPAPERTLDLTR